MAFPPESAFNQDPGEYISQELKPKEAAPTKRPTAQVPFERWYFELNDVLTTMKDQHDQGISEETEQLEDLRDEIYSYLRG